MRINDDLAFFVLVLNTLVRISRLFVVEFTEQMNHHKQ